MLDGIKDAVDTFPLGRVDSTNNCRRINKGLHLAINQDTDVEAQFVKGTVGSGDKREAHYFVIIPSGEISSQSYVVDGAVKQFIGSLFDRESLQGSHMYENVVIGELSRTPFSYQVDTILDS